MDSILIIAFVYVISVNGWKIEKLNHSMSTEHIVPPSSYNKMYP